MSENNETTTTNTPEEIVQQLRAVRERIADFVLLPPGESVTLTRAASVHPAFVQATISAVGASEPLSDTIRMTAEQYRQETELGSRWNAVFDEVDALWEGAYNAGMVRRHRIGLTALLVYQVSQQLVRKKEHAGLLPHVEAMRRHVKFAPTRRRKAGRPQPGPEPEPQPEPPASSPKQ
jgi:hypothetical protein